MTAELYGQTIHALQQQLQQGAISAAELTEAVLARIQAVEPRVRAYITTDPEGARCQAAAADARLQAGTAAPLTGIPIAVKDVLCTNGLATTCASRMLADFVPPYDAAVVERLRQQGAVIVGKTNMDEFAMGSSTETSWFGPVRNPWDLERVPGGSSGGSAAAVAADACIAALGSDTGGSIRQPAAYCGLVGIKPTYGRVSRYGLIAYASSLDQVGPMTKDVRDSAIMLQALSGYDGRDSTSVNRPVPDYCAALGGDVAGLTIGVPREYFVDGMDTEVEAAVRAAVALLEQQGATIRPISLPHTEYAVAAYYLIAPAEASANLARYDGVSYGLRVAADNGLQEMYARTRSQGFGAEVQRRIMLGTYALSAGYYDAYYKKASQVRTLIRRDFAAAFGDCDLVITPTAPTAAFRLGEKLDNPLSMYLSDIFTIPVNLAGLPALVLPCGFTTGGLPIGLQIIGDVFDEETILRCAYRYEQLTDWHRRSPALG